MRSAFTLAALIAALFGTGCATPYRSTAPENFRFTTKTDRGVLSSVKTTLHVYRPDAECRTEYLGSVRLGSDPLALGFDVGRPVLLVFEFVTSGWLSSSTSSTRWDTVLTPQPGRAYRADVTYLDDIYDVVLKERRGSSQRERTLDRKPCRPRG